MSKLSLPSWESLAPRLAANSYCVLPIERSEIELYGREHPAQGGWAFGLAAPSDPALVAPGVLCGRLPIEGGTSRAECEATRIAAVRVTALTAGLAASLEAIVREHVGGIGPVRNADDSLLILFKIDEDARAFAGQTGLHIDSENSVAIGSSGTCFLADGWKYHWRDGVSLVDVPRSQLPTITSDMVRPLIVACEDYLENRRPPAPPTALELRMQARVAHRRECGWCVLCADDVRVGDWVKVDRSDKHVAQIVPNPNGQPVPDDKGEFHINMDGGVYRAHGHRLLPTAAPVPVEKKPQKRTLMVGARYTVEVSEDAAS